MPDEDLTIACVDCGDYDIKVMGADETGGWLECQHCGAFFYHEFTNDEMELIKHA